MKILVLKSFKPHNSSFYHRNVFNRVLTVIWNRGILCHAHTVPDCRRRIMVEELSVDNNRAIIITIYYIVVQVFTTCKIFVIHYQA